MIAELTRPIEIANTEETDRDVFASYAFSLGFDPSAFTTDELEVIAATAPEYAY